jgi:protein gp37
MKKQWVTAIRDRCEEVTVSFFFKQWGGTNKKRTGRLLDDRTWDDMPRVAQKQLSFQAG